jgi:putative transposase
MEQFDISERRLCRALSQPRSTQRYLHRVRNGEELLTERIIELAVKYGRYAYR